LPSRAPPPYTRLDDQKSVALVVGRFRHRPKSTAARVAIS
jgi:hypothetical protein